MSLRDPGTHPRMILYKTFAVSFLVKVLSCALWSHQFTSTLPMSSTCRSKCEGSVDNISSGEFVAAQTTSSLCENSSAVV